MAPPYRPNRHRRDPPPERRSIVKRQRGAQAVVTRRRSGARTGATRVQGAVPKRQGSFMQRLLGMVLPSRRPQRPGAVVIPVPPPQGNHRPVPTAGAESLTLPIA
ncbi:MAG: hypothetical protein HQL73_06280 [Magnetococcales bacterium]|nr:hypothetical protein [Magnetococcales bacterium]